MEAVRKLPRLIMLYCIPHARYEINRTEVICRQGFLERKGQTHLPPGPSLPTSLTFQSLTCWARVAVREAKWITSPPDFLSFQALLHYWWVKSPKGAKKIKNSLTANAFNLRYRDGRPGSLSGAKSPDSPSRGGRERARAPGPSSDTWKIKEKCSFNNSSQYLKCIGSCALCSSLFPPSLA